MASVTLRNVTKRFDEDVAVDDVTLDIYDGEFLVLVGPSGCGKTTTLRMIAGLEGITDGVIKIGERIANDVHPASRDVAMVFQSYALYPHMSVFENLAYGLRRRGVKKREAASRVKQTADFLQMTELLHRRPSQLSGGQRQRVALGRAIVRHPSVFLMDEPLSNLDAKLRVEMRTELLRLHARLGVTTVYVTHDQVEAMTMGQRIAVMHEGRVQQIGPPLELYQQPANLFVAGFLGTPEMNRLSGQLVTQDGVVRFQGEGIATDVPGVIASGPARQVVLGIRPQHLRGVPTDAVGSAVDAIAICNAEVEFVEHLGPESYASVKAGRVAFMVSVPAGAQYGPGTKLTLSAHPTDLHLFDARTEQRFESHQVAAAAK